MSLNSWIDENLQSLSSRSQRSTIGDIDGKLNAHELIALTMTDISPAHPSSDVELAFLSSRLGLAEDIEEPSADPSSG